MSKQLKLKAVKDFCLATTHEPKPLNLDEDNCASQFKDFDAWTVHRKRAWTTLMCGAHYDYIDFSIITYCPTGTPDSQRYIRSWMKYLSEFIHSMDCAESRPITNSAVADNPLLVLSAFGVEGKDYAVYLAYSREVDDEGYGEAISATVKLSAPEGIYDVSLYSPSTGLYSPVVVMSGAELTIKLPPFTHDIAIRVTKQ